MAGIDEHIYNKTGQLWNEKTEAKVIFFHYTTKGNDDEDSFVIFQNKKGEERVFKKSIYPSTKRKQFGQFRQFMKGAK